MMKRTHSLVVAACLAGSMLVPFGDAQAALNAYMKLKGQKQGDIKGSVAKKGHEGDIAVLAVSHEILSPRDAASGQATGKRTHKPLRLTKELDRSTPLLYRAMLEDEVFSQVELAVFAPGDKVASTPLYTIRLVNASISEIRVVTQGEGKDAREVMEVSLVYKKIEWTWTDGGITAMDDWEAPVAAAAPKPKAPKAAGKG